MKKKIIITSLALLFVCLNFLTGCFGFFIDNDFELAQNNAKKLIQTLELDNIEKVKELFALNAIKEIDEFDKDIDDLLEYHEGECTKIIFVHVSTQETIEYGKYETIHNMSCDFLTTKTKYRMSIKWRVKDDFDKANEGIWSLDIIKYEEDLEGLSGYGGDGVPANGIYIGKVSVSYYFDKLQKGLVEERDTDLIEDLFAINAIQQKEDFNEELNALLSYVRGDYVWNNMHTPSGFYEENKTTYIIEYDVETTAKVYCIAIKWCTEDKENENNVGIWSLYINEYEGDDYFEDHTYVGDGLWTDGINIGIPNAQ